MKSLKSWPRADPQIRFFGFFFNCILEQGLTHVNKSRLNLLQYPLIWNQYAIIDRATRLGSWSYPLAGTNSSSSSLALWMALKQELMNETKTMNETQSSRSLLAWLVGWFHAPESFDRTKHQSSLAATVKGRNRSRLQVWPPTTNNNNYNKIQGNASHWKNVLCHSVREWGKWCPFCPPKGKVVWPIPIQGILKSLLELFP